AGRRLPAGAAAEPERDAGRRPRVRARGPGPQSRHGAKAPSMSSSSHPLPSQIDTLQQRASLAALVGAAACLLGGWFSPAQFFRSYLFAFLFWNGLAVGCLSIIMIHHLTGGLWGVAIRRLLEAGPRTFRLAWLLYIPFLAGVPRLYEWADRDKVAQDPMLQAKSPYLNVPFFMGRTVFYFA